MRHLDLNGGVLEYFYEETYTDRIQVGLEEETRGNEAPCNRLEVGEEIRAGTTVMIAGMKRNGFKKQFVGKLM